ncbi:RadC family protein [Achromobacter xylosoxidans]|uniref:JAB domain-containing protein n=1 Tax=Alcaligenes xylosoxydans xylosoxydans TaxID=85698 RepID=A0A424W5W4_ALCXX|nr:DNA repair protein RadC [Achromobacter xylosoxidans]MBC9907832.1 DNA repair protein RadC [Achromobacter xylosoxidans]MBD0872263.1 DNA repair protein RadC [Achromobacter xylosoxidans]QNP84314.1 DNA repair protein RadC [Achromobacter xylosoxidans]RPJ88633.1 JAB domain-containing protein [Achromobacter xylosoxidans]
MKLSDRLPKHERPRERLLRHGAAALQNSELLAIALRTGVPGLDVVELGNRLLARFGGLRGLLGTTPEELTAVPGLGTAKACMLAALLELARRAIEEDLARNSNLDHPLQVKQYCKMALGHRQVEHCIALYLDNRLRLIATGELARGTLSQASVYPREVVREALRHHAAALIIAHNHPSGLAEPSAADRGFTQHLKQALALVDIRLVDHLIVAAGTVVSMAELGGL